MQLKDVPDVVEQTLVNGQVVERLLYQDPATGTRLVHEHDVPFYGLQQRQILWMNALIDPTSIEDYIAVGGYSALIKALFQMAPDEIVESVKSRGCAAGAARAFRRAASGRVAAGPRGRSAT